MDQKTMDDENIYKISNSFMIDLTLKLFKENENLLVSPFSLVSALSMILTGSRGQSRDEILNALFEIKPDTLVQQQGDEKKFFETLIESFIDEIDKFLIENQNVFSNANMIYCDKRFSIKQEYSEQLIKYFKVVAKSLDFTKPEACGQINEDVKKATKGLIPSFLMELPDDVVLILVNAIHFKGMWKFPFPKESIHNGYFTKSNGEKKEVELMTIEKPFPMYYCSKLNANTIKLAYSSGSVSMVIILPDGNKSIKELASNLNSDHLDEILNNLTYSSSSVLLKMPKFKIESTHHLVPILQSLGLNTLFDHRADFSGISDSKLSVTDVIQKAIIDVNEEGTEAAAVTAFMCQLTCVAPPKPLFFVDRPFLFLMISNDNQHILFSGIVEDPLYY